MCLLCNGSAFLLPDAISNPADNLVVLGSAEFLEAFSQASMMWRNAELFELTPARLQDEANAACEKAIQLLNSSRNRYREILGLVRQHGAKPEALAALREFNYEKLAAEFNFSGDQWEFFVQTARSGNVYGLMSDFVEGTSRLVDGLEQQRAYLGAGRLPP